MTPIIVSRHQSDVGEELASSRRCRPPTYASTNGVSSPKRYAFGASGGGKLLPCVTVTCTPGARVESLRARHRGEGTACRAPTNVDASRLLFGASERLRDFSPRFQPGVAVPCIQLGGIAVPMKARR